MDETPSVTVVIPSYKRPSMVVAAVRSALAQSLVPCEVIVIDDASGDDTAQEVEALSTEAVPVRCITMVRNGGACRARNFGISLAQGTWIAFLDSDDAWEPGKLKRQMDALALAPACVASFTGMAVDGGHARYDHLPPAGEVTQKDVLAENILGSTSTAVVKRGLLLEVGGFDPDLPSCQDWDLWIRVLAKGPGIVVAEPLTLYSDAPHERISRSLGKVVAGHRIVQTRIYAQVTDRKAVRRLKAFHAMHMAEMRSYRWHEHMPALLDLSRSLAFAQEPANLKRSVLLVRFILWRIAHRMRRLAGPKPVITAS